jgi:hypothetical protein
VNGVEPGREGVRIHADGFIGSVPKRFEDALPDTAAYTGYENVCHGTRLAILHEIPADKDHESRLKRVNFGVLSCES